MKNFKVFSLFASLFLIFGMATTGCSQTNPNSATSNDSSISNSNDDTSTSTHEHTYSSSYEYDDTYHWHPSTCGHNVVSDKEKHTFKEEVTDPTYEQGGYTTYTCSTCGYSYIDNETNKLEHNYSSTWSYDEYSHWHACTDKGYEHLKQDESNHTFTTSITDPTYEQGGYTTYTCSTCGYSYIDDETNALPITITWKNYDGSILEVDNNVPYGTMPSYDGATPIKESDNLYKYYFVGWTPEVEPASEDTTYTAVFTSKEITYTVDFDLNGGTSSSYNGPIEVKIFSKDIFFFDCVKEDWQFRGWEYNGEKIFDEKGNQLKNVTLVDNMLFKAIYSQTVKLAITTNMPEAGTITGEGEYPYNTYVDVSVTPNQGYKFVGWYYQNTLLSNEVNYKYMMWDMDITLEARFGKDDFNLRIYSNNENNGLVLLKSNSVIDDYLPEYTSLKKYGSEVIIAAYSKSDVRFLGWYDENNELVITNAVYTFVMPNYDYTLEAKWNYFSINYNLNGGVNNPNNPDHYTIDDGNIYLQDPTKEGYSFLGWKCNGEFIETIDPSEGKNISFEAVWSSYEYEIIEGNNGKYASIIGFDKTIIDAVIPESINVYGEDIPVKVINSSVFENNDTIVSIIIPSSVTTIGYSAFRDCSNLETVTIGENSQLTTIESFAFDNCSSLTSIYIPDSVITIGNNAFSDCSSLTICCEASSQPSGWNSPWNYYDQPVVWNCKEYGITIEGIHYCVLIDEDDTKYITIVGYSGSSIDVVIPESINVNGEDIIVKTIGDNAFRHNDTITSVTISDSVTTIGDSAFSSCSSLTSIHIPDSVITIGEKAFYSCSSLTSIYIPDSVTSIGSYAFSGCSNLTIYCEASSQPSGWEYDWNYSDRPVVWSSYLEIHGNFNGIEYGVCIDEDGNKYITIAGYSGSNTNVVIPECINANGEDIIVKTITDKAFYDNDAITSVTIPDSVTTIGASAFTSCSSLTSIQIPDSVITIGKSAFSSCSSLTSIYIPDSVTTIGSYAFYECTSLTSIYIADSVTTIGASAFDGCSNLKTVTFSENSQLTTIEDGAFRYCSSLTSIYIPDSVTTIENYAFIFSYDLVIYCEASSKPSGWESDWNFSNRPVVWNCTYDEYLETIA